MAIEQQRLWRAGDSLPVGRVVLRNAGNRKALRYYLYLPRDPRPDLPLFVAVHGISINARAQARLFAPWAEAMGAVLVAPQFDPEIFGDYQRLGRPGLGERADLAFNAMLTDIEGQLQRAAAPACLFGFSGGAQFVHRYTMAWPERVHRQVLVAPGWFTFPDRRQRYPWGIARLDGLQDLKLDPRRFLRVPVRVMVGEKDRLRDASLRQSGRVDRRQGQTRIERARRWVAAMRREAWALGLETPIEFMLLEGCRHDFEQCMRTGGLGEKTFDFLYGDEVAPIGAASPVSDRRGDEKQ